MSQARLQNRVLPTGDIIAAPFRGAFTGNRGILGFDEHGRLGTSRWKHQHWIVCTLVHPRGRYHGPQPERGWTPLFFLDEAVALAAGHRPCAYCRPEAYRAWVNAWTRAFGEKSGHKEMDATLHAARVTRNRTQIRHQALLRDLPDHAFVLVQDQAHLVLDRFLYPFRSGTYGNGISRNPLDNDPVTVLTPRPTLDVLTAGYELQTRLE
ncbi:hypothetical protein ABLO27_11755 [Roseibium sp. SCPC15]|uniref:hypothetical protein n=1 Tax=Roseibium sp. SCP15 TaxID=3141376 RepID=UPI00333AA44C